MQVYHDARSRKGESLNFFFSQRSHTTYLFALFSQIPNETKNLLGQPHTYLVFICSCLSTQIQCALTLSDELI